MCVNPKLKNPTNQSYEDYPYIISPRKTYLINQKPTIRWNKVPGATSYVVTIMNGSEIHWQQEGVVDTEIVYPGEPFLNSGILYSIKIESNNNFSSESVSTETGWGFRMLDEELSQNLQNAITDLEQKSADEESDLELISLYMGYGLLVEAIKKLEQLANAESQDADVYCTLGELYSGVGLHLRAKEPLEKALTLLETGGDVKGQIIVKVALAQVKAALEINNETGNLLQEAQSKFEALANKEHRKEVQKKLEGSIIKDWQIVSNMNLVGCQNNCTTPTGALGELKGIRQKCTSCASF